MSDGASASAIDRLPWLEDEPRAAARRSAPGWWRWTPLALIPVAALSYWLGTETAPPPSPPEIAVGAPSAPVATMPLPEARTPAPPPAAPAVEPVAAPPAERTGTPAASATPVRKGRAQKRGSAAAETTPAKPASPAAKTEPKRKPLQYWPATVSKGAAGRMVRIGAFSSRAQAKRGWGKVMHIYPGMKRIPTAVVPIQSMRDGRTYYRLQMGTTSQAHSEVLCQRMRAIGQSCVVVGLIELQ